MILKLPDGQLVNMDNVLNYGQLAAAQTSVTFQVVGGTTVTYTDPTNNAANVGYVMNQIAAKVAARDTRQTQLSANPVNNITSISPVAFDIMTATVTIVGTGFSAATAGKLYIDDRGSGWHDGDGYYMTCTYISSTKMTAVFGGAGNGVLGPGLVMLSYIDTNGIRTNLISATNTTGTIITIP